MPRPPCALVAAAVLLVAGCDSGSTYYIVWRVPDAVTLAPGESTDVPFEVWREAPVLGQARLSFKNAPRGVSFTPSELSIPESQQSFEASPRIAVAANTPARLQTVTDLRLETEDTAAGFSGAAHVFLALLAPPVAQPDFSISVAKHQITLYRGQRYPIQVVFTVARTPDFTGPLTVTLASETPRVSALPVILAADQTLGTLSISIQHQDSVPLVTRFVATAEDGRQASVGFTFNLPNWPAPPSRPPCEIFPCSEAEVGPARVHF